MHGDVQGCEDAETETARDVGAERDFDPAVEQGPDGRGPASEVEVGAGKGWRE